MGPPSGHCIRKVTGEIGMKRKTADAARGKWRGILLALGIDEKYLTGKHGPCPMCEGRDRFRWDNQNGNGGFICNVCGAGNGFDLLMQVKGWKFSQAAAEVDQVCGNVEAEAARPKMDERARVDMLNRLWLSGTQLQDGDPAHAYLSGRVVLPRSLPSCLRYAPACPFPDGVRSPAMLALVRGADNEPVNIHRTALGSVDGKRFRATMPGDLPDGSAVRLFPLHGTRLGIAEGIETALAAAHRFNLPVWSALNATMLAKWQPPVGVTEVVVFGDCDPAYGGQAASFALAHRLAARLRLQVEVRIPQAIGKDWADADAA